jgi:ferrous-iron efflux pump FieF
MPADKEHRFGHGKSEAVAGVAQAIIITGSAVFVAVRAVARILDPAPIEALSIGLSVMTASLVLTIGLVAFQSFVVRRTGSVAVSADAAHYRADILTNVAVIVALFLSSEFGWLYADPILGLIVVLLILASARSVVQSALRDLLDHELPDKDREAIHRIAMNHADVLGVHEMRTRSSGVEQFVQLHIELDGILTLRRAHDISDEVEAQIKAQFPAADVLIHTDPFDG